MANQLCNYLDSVNELVNAGKTDRISVDVEKAIVPVGIELRIHELLVVLRRKILEVIGDSGEAVAQ